MSSLRILLLQARLPGDPVRDQERHSFATRCRLPAERLVTHDLTEGPPSLAAVRRHDALMIGGSGDFYVSRGNLPGFAGLLEVLREVVAAGHPTFASCFGFQSFVRALGGRIVYDPDRLEVGTYPLTLTAEGRVDPVVGSLPPRFQAQMGHKDRAASLPTGVVNLAASERCRYQAFRVPGAPIWATQFHPELDEEENRARYRRYLDGYASHLSDAEREAAMDRFCPSPEASGLLARFLDVVFG